MASLATYNIKFDPGEKFTWNVSFSNDDDSSIDVSGYSFKFVMKDSSGVPVWTILDADMTRPNNYTVQFEKSQPIISALPAGVYTYSFYVTNTLVTDDEWVGGIITR